VKLKVFLLSSTKVNFSNILRAALLPISFRQKITNTNCKQRKAAQKLLNLKVVHEMLAKLTPLLYVNRFSDQMLVNEDDVGNTT